MNILSGKITQEGTNQPVITLFNNPLNAVLTTTYEGEGQYKVESSIPLFNSDMPSRWYVANSEHCIYAISQDSQLVCHVQCFDKDGVPVDGRLQGNLFEIEIY